jgi:type I restriction enzyme S subunit
MVPRMTNWIFARVDWLCDVARDTVSVEELAEIDLLVHYSVDGLAATGEPITQPGIELLSSKLRVAGGEVLVSRLNPRRGHVALTAVHELPAVCSGEWVVLRPRRGIDLNFLHFLFQSQHVRSRLEASVRSVTKSHGRVNADGITKMWVQFPSLSEQKKIAEFLDRETQRIDEAVLALRRLNVLAQERRRVHIDQSLKEISCGEMTQLRHLLKSAPTYGVLTPEFDDGPTGVPLIRIVDLDERNSVRQDEVVRISEHQAKEYRRTMLEPGDLILSVVGTLGKCAIVPDDCSGANISRALARLKVRTSVDRRWILWWTQSFSFIEAVARSTYGTAQTVLNMGDLARYEIPVPPDRIVPELDRLEADLAERDAVSDLLKRQICLLRERREALISAAVSGQLDVEAVA